MNKVLFTLLCLLPIYSSFAQSDWFDPDHYYIIKNTKTSKVGVLDVLGDRANDRAQETRFNDLDTQKWRIIYLGTENGTAYFQLFNKAYGFDYALDNYDKPTRLLMRMNRADKSDNTQWWKITKKGNEYQIANYKYQMPLSQVSLKWNSVIGSSTNRVGMGRNSDWLIQKAEAVDPLADAQNATVFIQKRRAEDEVVKAEIARKKAAAAETNAMIAQGLSNAQKTIQQQKAEEEKQEAREKSEAMNREMQARGQAARERSAAQLEERNEKIERNRVEREELANRIANLRMPESGIIYKVKGVNKNHLLGYRVLGNQTMVSTTTDANKANWEFIPVGYNKYIIRNEQNNMFLKSRVANGNYVQMINFTRSEAEATKYIVEKSPKGSFYIRREQNRDNPYYLYSNQDMANFTSSLTSQLSDFNAEWELELVRNNNIPNGWSEQNEPKGLTGTWYPVFKSQPDGVLIVSKDSVVITNQSIQMARDNQVQTLSKNSSAVLGNLTRTVTTNGSNGYYIQEFRFDNNSQKYYMRFSTKVYESAMRAYRVDLSQEQEYELSKTNWYNYNNRRE